jgi:hypothetical protein
VIQTRLGPVEVMYQPGDKPVVLFFPGGHCSAASDCGWSLYTSEGHGVLAFSRPGYGNTDVGRLNAAEFVPAVAECCEDLGIEQTAGGGWCLLRRHAGTSHGTVPAGIRASAGPAQLRPFDARVPGHTP